MHTSTHLTQEVYTTDQSTENTQVQLAEPVSFPGVTCRNRDDSKAAASPQPTPAWTTAHEAATLETTTVSRSSTGWRVSFPSDSTQPLPCSWSGLRLLGSYFTAHSGGEEPDDSGLFQGLPEASLSCLPSCPGSFQQDRMF